MTKTEKLGEVYREREENAKLTEWFRGRYQLLLVAFRHAAFAVAEPSEITPDSFYLPPRFFALEVHTYVVYRKHVYAVFDDIKRKYTFMDEGFLDREGELGRNRYTPSKILYCSMLFER